MAGVKADPATASDTNHQVCVRFIVPPDSGSDLVFQQRLLKYKI
jgi:hypothetical protein